MTWKDLFIGKHPEVYEPSDDTFLLAQVVADTVRDGTRFVEVGCGAGLVSLAAAQQGATVVCTDRNPYAVQLTQVNAKENKLRVDAREADLLEGIAGPVDVVAFNPPYLPTAEDEHVEGPLDWAFDGGPDGNAVVLRFVDQVLALAPRIVLVIHSSLSDPGPLVTRMEAAGYRADIAAEEAHFQERLTVRRFQA